MKLVATTTTLAVLISFQFSAILLGLSQGRRQPFEGVITLPSRNAPQPPAFFAGTVVSEATGQPLAGATVTLSHHFGNAVLLLLSESEARTVIAPVTTNDRGGFSFQEIAADAYDLTIQMDGYLTQKLGPRTPNGPGPYVTLASGQRIDDFKVGLVRSARIGGHIRTETGQPSEGIPLQLVQADPLNLRWAMDSPVVQSTSAADGSYNLGDFAPGRYVLLAGFPLALNGEPGRSFATELNIPNTEAQTLDFSLDTKGGYSIRGKVSVGTQVPPAAVEMTIRATRLRGNPLTPGAVSIPYNYDARDGAFEIPGLFPGIYEISVSAKDSQAPAQNLDGAGRSFEAWLKDYAGCGSITVVISRASVTGFDLTVKQCQ